MVWYFLGYLFRISDGHLYPFYPEVPPPGILILKGGGGVWSFLSQNLWSFSSAKQNFYYIAIMFGRL